MNNLLPLTNISKKMMSQLVGRISAFLPGSLSLSAPAITPAPLLSPSSFTRTFQNQGPAKSASKISKAQEEKQDQAPTLVDDEETLEGFKQKLGEDLPVSEAKLNTFMDEQVRLFRERIKDADQKARFDKAWAETKMYRADSTRMQTISADSQERTLRMLARLINKWPIEALPKTGGDDIFFATCRLREGNIFTHKPSSALTYGRCTVHKEVVAGTSALNPNRITTVLHDDPYWTNDDFSKAIVFIHGYNQSFEQAIECAHKLKERLIKDGTLPTGDFRLIVFSWPSYGDCGWIWEDALQSAIRIPFPGFLEATLKFIRQSWLSNPTGYILTKLFGFLSNRFDVDWIGKPLYYIVDQAACEGSEACFPQFLSNLASNVSLDEIHVMGHSMGCRLVLRGLTDVDADAAYKIKSVTFASADVDKRMFEQVLPTSLRAFQRRHPNPSECTFVLFLNDKDAALLCSRWLFMAPRAGRVENNDYPKIQGCRCFIIDSSEVLPESNGILFSEDWVCARIRHFDFLYVKQCRDVFAQTVILDQIALREKLDKTRQPIKGWKFVYRA